MFKPIVVTSFAIALFCAVSAIPVKAAPVKTSAPSAATIEAGHQVFLKNCFPCHSTNEGQQKVGPSLYHVNSGPKPRHTATEIRGFLQNGKKGTIGQMPPFKDILTKEDTDNLLAYIHTL